MMCRTFKKYQVTKLKIPSTQDILMSGWHGHFNYTQIKIIEDQINNLNDLKIATSQQSMYLSLTWQNAITQKHNLPKARK